MGFGNLKGKKPQGAGSYINGEVECVVEVTANKATLSQQDSTKYFFITEFKIVEVLEGDIKLGSSWGQTININSQAGPSDCVAFLAAAAGLDPYNTEGDFEEALLSAYSEAFEQKDLSIEIIAEMVCDENQPLVGIKLRLKTINKGTRAGGTFTKHMWYPTEDDS